MNNFEGFKIEARFQDFLYCFPGLTDREDVIDMLRDFFYHGAGEIMAMAILSPGSGKEFQEMFNEVLEYDRLKEAECIAENN